LVEGDATFLQSPNIDGNLTVLGLISVGNFSLGVITGISEVTGDSSIVGNLTVLGSATFWEDLTVTQDTTVNGRLDILEGPLSFSYPGLLDQPLVGPDFIRTPNPNLTECCSEYLVNFAPVGSPAGQVYDLLLTGYTLNILNPGLSGVFVYRMETFASNGTDVLYSYEVGDIILLRGSPVLSTSIVILDFEDVLKDAIGTDDGNIYNGRDLVTEAMGSFARILQSDEIFLYMYSPRPGIGRNAGSNPPGSQVIQDAPVEWVRIGLGDERY